MPKEAEAVRAGKSQKDAVGVGLELGHIGAIVGHGERRKQFLDDLAAILLEHALEAGAHLLAIGDVVGDGDHALVLELLGAIIRHRMGALRRGRGGADEPGIGMTLGHVLGGRDGQRRGFGLADVVVDRQRLEGGERADQAMDIVALDQLLRLGARGRGNAGRVGDDQFDLAAGELVVALLQIHHERALHVDAARGQRSGLHGQKPDADRRRRLPPRPHSPADPASAVAAAACIKSRLVILMASSLTSFCFWRIVCSLWYSFNRFRGMIGSSR